MFRANRLALGGVATLLALATGAVPAVAAQSSQSPPTPSKASAAPSTPRPNRVANPDATLPSGWRKSSDRAVTVSGDSSALHVLVADSAQAYSWRTVASLAEPGFDTDMWVGNSCVTASGQRAVVVYAPRSFTNNQQLSQRGAFAAVVDLRTGAVTKLADQVSLAYFDPGCGAGESVVLTQEGTDEAKTRLLVVDTVTATVTQKITVDGQVTSAVPVKGGVVAAQDGQLTHFDAKGHARALGRTSGFAFGIHPDAQGGVAFMDATAKTERAHSLRAGHDTAIATGALGTIGLQAGTGSRVFLAQRGHGPANLPAGIAHVDADPGSVISTQGAMVVDQAVPSTLAAHVASPLAAVAAGQTSTIDIQSRIPATGKSLSFRIDPAASGRRQGGVTTPSPALRHTGAGAATSSAAGASSTGTAGVTTASFATRSLAVAPMTANSGTSTTDDVRGCAIPRNDPSQQVLQPTPNQVEWAADMAIRGDLTSSWVTQGGWRATDGLGTVNPQGMFPLPALTGGGRIPAQVLLGILAQESNLWQASSHALPGETGNPLVSSFYGNPTYDPNNPDAFWTIDFTKVDCGYGAGQQTDGMHSSDYLRPGDQVLPADQQKAIALDYTSNIAVAAQTLAKKWNELHDPSLPAPIAMNNDSASNIENWFAAAWDYNEGFNPYSATSAWGLGWGNNPANPIWDPNRLAFLDNNHYADAATPQKWPYEEKVMGWAGWPLDTGHSFDDSGNPNSGNTAGYSAAWWGNAGERTMVKPPLSTFCNSNNACDTSSVPHCVLGDISCFQSHWYTKSVSWKLCASGECGNEYLTYKTLRVEPGNGKLAPPDCDTSKIPSGSLIIDSVSGAVPPMAGSCSRTWSDAGTLSFSFTPDANGQYEGKEDLHQIGGGFGSHFWFAHTRNDTHDSALMQVYGTYRLTNSLNAWTRVMVHVPDTGATTAQAAYTVHLGDGTSETRTIDQHYNANTWVDLGVFHFVPGSDFQGAVLTNYTQDGTGDEDIAWDAMAFQPLPQKPADFVVALGDSYSSGEGTGNYYTNSNIDGGLASADACHRSPNTWSRQATLADSSSTIGVRADSRDTTMDYHLIACSGAKTNNVLSVNSPTNSFAAANVGQNGELPQLDQGYLDSNTTLVTMSIGGNDSRFSGIVQDCIFNILLSDCADVTHTGDSAPLGTAEPLIMANQVHDSIVLTLHEIHNRAPNAKIVLMGYPPLFSNHGSCLADRITTGVISAELIETPAGVLAQLADIAASPHIAPDADWMNQLGGDLVTAMGKAATDAGSYVSFSNPTDAFNGQAICGSPQTLNDFVLPHTAGEAAGLLPSQQSFHPTAAGALNYASALNSTLRTMGM